MKKKAPPQFDPAALDDHSVAVYLFCLDLAKVNAIGGDSLLAEAQSAAIEQDHVRAIERAHAYLLENDIDLALKPVINHAAFGLLRRAQEVDQNDLARALGCTASAICQFERGHSKLRFVKVLIAAELIGIAPERVFIRPRSEPHLALVKAKGSQRHSRNRSS